MAPFNTHFLVAEKIWPTFDGPWQPFYGQFCFGCVAPDVDKRAASLTQKDTHFYDRTDEPSLMATHRTSTFLAIQAHFLRLPFTDLPPPEQAFVLGYLCHLAVDEVSKQMWGQRTWQPFQEVNVGPLAAFSALDEFIVTRFQDYAAIAEGLCAITPPDTLPRIPYTDLVQMHAGVCAFVSANTPEDELYTILHGVFAMPPDEAKARGQTLLTEIPRARKLVSVFEIDTLIADSLSRSHSRMMDLILGRVSEPWV